MIRTWPFELLRLSRKDESGFIVSGSAFISNVSVIIGAAVISGTLFPEISSLTGKILKIPVRQTRDISKSKNDLKGRIY
jgi:hypothetical protein